MKDLSTILKESVLNEAKETIIAFFNHDNPTDTKIYIGSNPKAINYIKNSDYYWLDAAGSGSCLYIQHSDEWNQAVLFQNEAVIKKMVYDAVKNALKDLGPDDYVYFDAGIFGWEPEDEDEITRLGKMSENAIYKTYVVDYIKDSYIDRDSSSASALIDLNKKKPIIKGDIDISFYDDDDIIEMFEE